MIRFRNSGFRIYNPPLILNIFRAQANFRIREGGGDGFSIRGKGLTS